MVSKEFGETCGYIIVGSLTCLVFMLIVWACVSIGRAMGAW
jgi:hypothetical protein